MGNDGPEMPISQLGFLRARGTRLGHLTVKIARLYGGQSQMSAPVTGSETSLLLASAGPTNLAESGGGRPPNPRRATAPIISHPRTRRDATRHAHDGPRGEHPGRTSTPTSCPSARSRPARAIGTTSSGETRGRADARGCRCPVLLRRGVWRAARVRLPQRAELHEPRDSRHVVEAGADDVARRRRRGGDRATGGGDGRGAPAETGRANDDDGGAVGASRAGARARTRPRRAAASGSTSRRISSASQTADGASASTSSTPKAAPPPRCSARNATPETAITSTAKTTTSPRTAAELR